MMTDFRKYQHVERFGSEETEGLLDGVVHIFYKIDGTNGSIWASRKMSGIALGFGSRNRELSLDNDNAGFMNESIQDERYTNFFRNYPDLRLFGEWLVPHSLKTYNIDAWRKFYVFDVFDKEEALSYDTYKPLLDQYGIHYIPPLCIMKNPNVEDLYKALEKCGQFLIQDGKGIGEGIVLKNYDYQNKYGRQTWGKIISNEFKTVHHREMGAPLVIGSKIVEEEIIEHFVTEAFIQKERAKIIVENNGEWENKLIPKLLDICFYELVREETWNILKKHKNPKINFSLLQKMTQNKVKRVIGL